MAPLKQYILKLPGGGNLHLQSLEELELLNTQKKHYADEYQFEKLNDRVLLGTLLTQQLALYRSQQTISGMEPEIDAKGKPTGAVKVRDPKPSYAEMKSAQESLNTASEQIMKLEKTLGIDKKTRESGGQHTLQKYLTVLKRAGNELGVHINERTKKYEAFVMEFRTRLRILNNADAEDRQYHGITKESVLQWAHDELVKLEDADKEFAATKGELWRGRL